MPKAQQSCRRHSSHAKGTAVVLKPPAIRQRRTHKKFRNGRIKRIERPETNLLYVGDQVSLQKHTAYKAMPHLVSQTTI
jgi:hypothetical protein